MKGGNRIGMLYPPSWARCPACDDHMLDGHVTCGHVGAGEAEHR